MYGSSVMHFKMTINILIIYTSINLSSLHICLFYIVTFSYVTEQNVL